MSREVASQVIIDMPRAAAWQRLCDISLAHNYVPGIVDTEIVGEQSEGIGASRYVYRRGGNYLQETVTEWHDGEGFLIRLHRGDKGPPLFRSAFFRYRLEDDGPQQTLFTASMSYELPWGALGRWLEGRLAGFVQSTVADVAIAMKLYYESGEPTTPEALKAYKEGHD